ncbi:MAG: hypothetical protein ACRD04_05685 [Terriglobales bacterium]
MDLKLSGLDARDIVSSRHPWLQALAALEQNRFDTSKNRTPSPGANSTQSDSALHPSPAGDLAWDLARRLRVASVTPSGRRQPSEIAGVDASARVPNSDQTESGEMAAGHEVSQGRPAFFGPLMPPPSGIANGVGVPSGPIVTHPFGAPLGMNAPLPPISASRLATRPSGPPAALAPRLQRRQAARRGARDR